MMQVRALQPGWAGLIVWAQPSAQGTWMLCTHPAQPHCDPPSLRDDRTWMTGSPVVPDRQLLTLSVTVAVAYHLQHSWGSTCVNHHVQRKARLLAA